MFNYDFDISLFSSNENKNLQKEKEEMEEEESLRFILQQTHAFNPISSINEMEEKDSSLHFIESNKIEKIRFIVFYF
jgi:DNA-binding MltR family transcriptional regulator